MTQPRVHAQFDEATHTVSYVVWDPATCRAAIIDPVLDYDHRTGHVSHRSADDLLGFVADQGLSVDWVLETHAHADHLSAAPYLKEKTGAPIGIGARITEVQRTFAPVFGLEDVSGDGREFDRLFRDGETIALGGLQVEVMHTPGHTPACLTYVIGDAAFVGDTLFMPDGGSARADFPGGDARTLFRSIHRLLSLRDDVVLYMCHDYAPNGRPLRHVSTVGEQRHENIHVADGISEDDYVKMREARDATLGMPKLIIPTIQVNMKAGQ